MNIFPSPEQRLNPFQFYADMRHNNPVAYDDRNNIWAVFRYYDVQFILGDYTHFSSAVPPTKLDNNLSKEGNKEEKKEMMPFSRPSLRLEARVALKTILERLQDLELDESKGIKPLDSLIFHGVSQLPLRFTPSTATI